MKRWSEKKKRGEKIDGIWYSENVTFVRTDDSFDFFPLSCCYVSFITPRRGSSSLPRKTIISPWAPSSTTKRYAEEQIGRKLIYGTRLHLPSNDKSCSFFNRPRAVIKCRLIYLPKKVRHNNIIIIMRKSTRNSNKKERLMFACSENVATTVTCVCVCPSSWACCYSYVMNGRPRGTKYGICMHIHVED